MHVYFLFCFQLEDKRAEMERQLISMKVQYKSLQKQHAFSKQQLQRMKVLWAVDGTPNLSVCTVVALQLEWCGCSCIVQVQIATLMQLQGSRADPAQLERLQSMLSEKNEEIQNLVTKLERMEKVELRAHKTSYPQEKHHYWWNKKTGWRENRVDKDKILCLCRGFWRPS